MCIFSFVFFPLLEIKENSQLYMYTYIKVFTDHIYVIYEFIPITGVFC